MLGTVESIGNGLIDRHRHGPRVRLRAITAMNRNGFNMHPTLVAYHPFGNRRLRVPRGYLLLQQ